LIYIGSAGLVVVLIAWSWFLGASASKWKLVSERSESHAPPFLAGTFFDRKVGLLLSPTAVRRTHDGGETWKTVLERDTVNFTSLSPYLSDSALIVGSENERPVIFKTENKGVTWQRMVFAEGPSDQLRPFTTFHSTCFEPPSRLWLAGDGGVVLATVAGEALNVLDVFRSATTVFSVTCDSSSGMWAAGESNSIINYRTGWITTSLKDHVRPGKIEIANDAIWIVGRGSPPELLRSRDQGASWEHKEPNFAGHLFDIHFQNQEGWLVGSGGIIFHTIDGGDSWSEIKSPTKNDLLDVFFDDSTRGWIVGDRMTILRSQN